MPNSPPMCCPTPGCGGRHQAGQPCEKCGAGKRDQKQYDRQRGHAAARGYDYRWQKFRDRYLAEYPVCEDCSKQGIVSAATDIHHIAKLANHPERKYDESNLMPLCGDCHKARTAKGE